MLRSVVALMLTLALVSACGTPKSSPRVGPGFVNGKPVHPTVKMGDPYTVKGETYVPEYQPSYTETGEASWYGPGFHGGSTANGEKFDTGDMTAAHRTLPMPSMVRVTNMANGKSVVVRVNDRGPFSSGRIIDVSKAAAEKLDMIRSGVAKVKVEYLQRETEAYIAQLSGGKSPEQIAWEEKHTVRVASNDARGYGVTEKTTEPLSMETAQVADYSGVTQNDLPPLTPEKPKATPIKTGAAASGNTSGDTNRSYVHSPFDSIGEEAAASKVSPPAHVPKTPAPAPKATADPALHRGGSYIQVGAFSNRANAEKISQRFANAHVQGVPVEAPSVYRVRIGPFTDRYSAESMLSQVREQVPDAQLIQQ